MSKPSQLEVALRRIDIQTLIDQLESGKIVLPDFQRDFVWRTKQVGKLLESLLNGYYINTLLTLPVLTGSDRSPPFPPRWVKGVGRDGKEPANWQMEMVLDGQQRVTSIYYAMNAPEFGLSNTVYPQLFYLDFERVLEGKLDEDTVDWRRRDWDSSQRLVRNDYEEQLEQGRIPFTIFKNNDSFKEWRRGMEEFGRQGGEITRQEIYRFEEQTEVFRGYEIPIIQLDASTSETKVVRTFERINTQGLELGIFDILTARLWTEDIRLRDLWEDTLQSCPRVSAYASASSEERLRKLILKTLALSRGEECRNQKLRELEPRGFEDDWHETSRMMNRALDKLYGRGEGGFGVTDRFGLPYTTILAPLSPLVELAERTRAYPDGEQLRKIGRWYWSSVFSARYSGSSDTKAYKDVNQMAAWMKGKGEVPEAIQEAPDRIRSEVELWSITRGGLYIGIMCLLTLNGAKDFGTFENIDLHEIDDHHIFPNSRLRDGVGGTRYDERTPRNRILNRTVIESRGNRYKYRDQLPSEYLRKMVDEHPGGEDGVRKLLEHHFIDDDGFEAMKTDDYESFCESRMAVIREAIEERVGASIDWSEETRR